MAKILLDKEREIVFDLNAMCRYEEATGKNAFEGMQNLKASDLRALLWACLHDKKLTLEDVGAMITADNMGQISEALTLAFGNPTSAQSG